MAGEGAAEAAVRRVCELIVAGDYINAMAEVTPEALAQVMNLGAGMMNLPAPEGYEVKTLTSAGSEHSFQVCFIAQAQELRATVSMREVDGAWKVSGVSDVQVG